MGSSKLTLKLDEEIIEEAKAYAAREGVSLSRMVANYFAGLASREDGTAAPPSGTVAELAGLLAGKELGSVERDYAGYLERKYS
jgi:hypothetical protein